ncbi:tRNA pseudouridine(54/55) synthase Pus10 [Candidatus Micrarchaeota archaeon]|nr:tRNA pseudouridine(54/55) synthase Pus10 [Candidatus Micrarchaeota archaeon]
MLNSKKSELAKINKKIPQLLQKYNLCNNCLARQFLSDRKKILSIKTNSECYLCNNIFSNTKQLIEKAITLAKNLEFRTFLVGTQVPREMLTREEAVWDYNGIENTESIKTELNRLNGRILEKKLKKKVDFANYDLLILLDFINNNVKVQITPIYIYGHYLKLSRELSQTKWPCDCNGKGCEKCNFKGKMYTSVEDLVGYPVIAESSGIGSKFHGAGREDVNARMLGNGRAFILEISEPKKRKLDLRKLEKTINSKHKKLIQVKNLAFCKKSHVELLKSVRLEKVYRAIARAGRNLTKEDLAEIMKLNIINQNTPTRVLHRRADKERMRSIKSITGRLLGKKKLELIIAAEAGTYIKELINGDNGRTKPSVAEILNTNVACVELDVIKIKDGFLDELMAG